MQLLNETVRGYQRRFGAGSRSQLQAQSGSANCSANCAAAPL